LKKEVSAVEKHAMALGYFFLAAFCLFARGHSALPLQLPLLWAGWAAVLIGAEFFVSACAPLITEIQNWFRVIKQAFVELARQVPLARELPPHRSASQEDRPSKVVAE
jgi:hypothetical protein